MNADYQDKGRLSAADEIADMIVREALEREGNLGIPERVCKVENEVMLKVMETLDGVREAERKARR